MEWLILRIFMLYWVRWQTILKSSIRELYTAKKQESGERGKNGSMEGSKHELPGGATSADLDDSTFFNKFLPCAASLSEHTAEHILFNFPFQLDLLK